MESKYKTITCFFFLTIIPALFFKVHVATCKDLHEHAKVILKYPLYSGLEEESFQIIEGKPLSDYLIIGETKLKSLFGLEVEDGLKVRVNEIELEKSEFSHSISEFKVAENEDILIEFILKDEFNSQNKSKTETQIDMFGKQEDYNLKTQEGILILGFSSIDDEVFINPSKVPKTVSVREKFPMTFGELKKVIENFANPLEFSIESVKTLRNPNKELKIQMNSKEQNKMSDLENGDLIKIKIRDLSLSNEENEDTEINNESYSFKEDNFQGFESGSQGDFPVMIVFSNIKEVPSKLINLNEDSKVGDLLERLYKITFPGTENALISKGDRIAIQNEEGREVDQTEEVELKDFVPEGVNISKNRPFVIYVTVFGGQEEDSKVDYSELSMRQDLSKIFEKKDEKDIEDLVFNSNNQVKTIDSDFEAIPDRRKDLDSPIVKFLNQVGKIEYEIKGDPSLTTIASLYSQAQLVWNSRGNKEKNCLLVYEGNNKEDSIILDPNDHETISTSKIYYQGMNLTMKEPKKVKVEILVYLTISKESEDQIDDKILFTRNLEIPEIISVFDFLKMVYLNYSNELSKYLIIGVQKNIENEKLIEYLPVPKTPSSITYLTFHSERNDVGVFIEVLPTKSVEIMLMIPSNSIGEEISEKSEEDSDLNDESLFEYRLKILSNTTVKELIESLIERKILDKSIPAKTVHIKDKESDTYLNNEYIIGHHSTGKKVGKKKRISKMIFVVEIIEKFNLNVMFYNYKGEEFPIEPFQLMVKSNQSIKKLKEDIVSNGVKQGISLDVNQMGIGSGFDIGKEFKKVVYTILKETDKVENSGLLPNDELRVYLLKESQEGTEKKKNTDFGIDNQIKFENMSINQGSGPKLEIPLSIENCPLNTMLERRWFIVPMTLGLPIGELKELIDNIAMLGGMDFDLFGETEKGKLELNQESESCLSLGVTELGHLTAICNGKKIHRANRKVELDKSVSQAILDDICEDDENSDKCNKPTGEVLDKLSNYKKDQVDAFFEEDSTEELSEKEIKEREEKNRESMELLKRIEKKINQLEEEELKLKKNKKMMDKLIKKETLNSSKNNLNEKELVKLLRDFLTVYVSKGTAGLNRFCRRQGSDRIEQLVMYTSTIEGRKMSRKLAKKIAERERRKNKARKNKRKAFSGKNMMLNLEYSIMPKIAQYSEYEEESSSSYTSENSDLSRSEEQSIPQVKGSTKLKKKLTKNRDLEKRSLNGDLDPVTKIQKRSKKKNRIIRALKKIPVISPTVSFLYSRLSTRGKKRRKAKKYIKEIRELEIQFRKKAYEHFQNINHSQKRNENQEEDYMIYLMSY
ncbi:uncharacterized protein cubi_00883 [Cryptosporidium ubiquitum]|uniref:Uncharacterized protein n=1 Tax=Cryptosporidium ubiquitum TaxID=857276 RepID=A0A1J4ML94_9CRYT|nr:uncharacterized protein cubi_00883 [Cryptosporidium ubiquitum]OII74958.1 hypothetical protein cubi_00883 [Cryptosporidium ubiquitum]